MAFLSPSVASLERSIRPAISLETSFSAVIPLSENKQRQAVSVSGHSKPAREGQMKTSHFESGIAHGAAKAALVRDVPTQREPATFHRHTGGQRLVGAQNCPRTEHSPGDGGAVFAPGVDFRKGSPISVRGQETNRSPSASFFFSKSCLCLFWPSRTAPVVPFVPVISVLFGCPPPRQGR